MNPANKSARDDGRGGREQTCLGRKIMPQTGLGLNELERESAMRAVAAVAPELNRINRALRDAPDVYVRALERVLVERRALAEPILSAPRGDADDE